MPEHILEETLIEYAADPDSVADRAAVEAHLSSCSSCRRTVEDYRKLAGALTEEETWWMSEAFGDESRALTELSERCAREDAAAAEMLAKLLDSQYRFAYRNIARRKRYHTGGVVRLLCRTARAECDKDPRFALSLADAAAAIAEALPDDYYPANAVNELRGTAWKEYSTACRYLARFANGFDALHRAERAYKRLRDPGSHLASVELGRAVLLWEQQRYDEALVFARSAAEHFAERRETERYLEAKETEAAILHRQGRIDAALETYRSTLDLAETIDDAEMKARALRNLAIASRDRGDVGSASKYFLLALQLYEGLDQHAVVVQIRWSIARLALTAGNAKEAARRLPELIAELDRLEMTADAARARLDLAEALLVLDDFDTVTTICTTLVATFRDAEMLTGALMAAAYLKEAAAHRTLTPQQIEHVRTYLRELERRPDLVFAPLPDIN